MKVTIQFPDSVDPAFALEMTLAAYGDLAATGDILPNGTRLTLDFGWEHRTGRWKITP